jgi:hypothetical protein
MSGRPAHILSIVLAAAFFCAFALPGLTQPAEVLIDKSADFPGGLKRGPVPYNPEAHMGYVPDCTDCHHNFVDGKNTLDPGELMDGTFRAAAILPPRARPAGGSGCRSLP